MKDLRLVEELNKLGVTLSAFSRFTGLATGTLYKVDLNRDTVRKTTLGKVELGLSHFRAQNERRQRDFTTRREAVEQRA